MRALLALSALGAVGRGGWAAPATPAPNVVGTWRGALEAGPQRLTMIFKVTRGADGALAATISVPEQGLADLPFNGVEFVGDKLTLTLALVNGKYEGQLSADGKTLEGKWTQNGMSFDLPMELGEEAKPNRPQEPKPPFPYQVEEVSYENAAAQTTFQGTLTAPDDADRHPAVFLISGSGPQDRDETLMGHKPFWVLADHLTRQGFVVLRSDDRGVNGTAGSTARSTMEDHAGDALAAVEYLKTRPEVDPARIGLLGHSEGAVVAPMAAVQSDDIAFVVLLAPMGVDGRSLIQDQATRLLSAAGAPPDMIAETNALRGQLFDIVLKEPDEQKAREQCMPLIETAVRQQLGKPEGDDEGIDRMVASQVDELVSPWMRFFLGCDPTDTLSELTTPALALWGEKDLQVAPELNADPVEAALKKAGNARFDVDVLPGLNHLFQHCATGQPQEYFSIEETIAPEALERITEWLLEVTKP